MVFIYIYRLNYSEDYTKKVPNQKREKSKSKLFKTKQFPMRLDAFLVFDFGPIKKLF